VVHTLRVAEGKDLRMYVIAGNDIVSSSIRGGGWETSIHAAILRILRGSTSKPLFLDVGANVGFHAVNVAAAGFKVLAIEAAPTNQALLRATQCANQGLAT
jgi:hypothetical protein